MLDLMRRYAYGFVNSHDPEVARQIMAEDYRLHMGTDTIVGRDDSYIPAVLHQIAQFPALGFAIHDLVTDGTTTALLFSEHGRSLKQPDRSASWKGVSIYRLEAGRLAECWVEQDHYGRRHQLATGIADPVPQIALDPWSGHVPTTGAAKAASRAALEAWAGGLEAWPPAGAVVDSGSASEDQPRIAVERVEINVFVAEGDRIAFNATIVGAYQGGLPGLDTPVSPVEIYVGAFAVVVDGEVRQLEAVSNRVAVQRQLRSAAPEGGR